MTRVRWSMVDSRDLGSLEFLESFVNTRIIAEIAAVFKMIAY